MMQTTTNNNNRIVFLDFLRVIACFMVIVVHSCEFFFIGENGINIRSEVDGFWVSIIDSALRSSVPLFVMASAYLLLPLKEDTTSFFKRRFIRVVIPFIIWSVLYAVLPCTWGALTLSQAGENLTHLLFNFNGASGHLWFVYMLIGLYLFMPVISPWLKEVSRKFELSFLALWFIASFYHYAKQFTTDLYGECYWNEFHLLWYFSGFIGYLVLAHYIRTYVNWSLKKSLFVGIPLFLCGYLFTAIVFYNRTSSAVELQELELSWRFCSFNVIFMATGLFLIIKKINCRNERIYGVIKQISNLSYGMYLMHIFILNVMYQLLSPYFNVPVTILLVGTLTFLSCWLLTKLLSYLPGSKYIVG